MGVFVLIEVFAFQISVYTVSLPNVRSFRCGSLVLGSGSGSLSLSLVMDVLFPERYALHDPLAMPKSRRCNPSYVVRQPVILQCVHILFHHYKLLATTSLKEFIRTHTHRISKSIDHLATAIGGEIGQTHSSGMEHLGQAVRTASVPRPSRLQPLHSSMRPSRRLPSLRSAC